MAAGLQRLLPALTLVGLALWMGCSSESSADSGLDTSQPTTTYSFSIVEGQLPSALFMGRERSAHLVLRNDGFSAWPKEQKFYVSPRWLGLTGDEVLEEGFRTPLRESVAPGESLGIAVRVKPPSGFGLYRIHWDLQSESSGWFSQFDRTPEPRRWVVVMPHVEFFLAVLLPLSLLALALAIRRRSSAGVIAIGYVAVADLIWCAASLLTKPLVLYGELASKFWPGPKPVTFSVVAFLLLPIAFLPARARALAAWCLAGLGALTVWTQLLYFRFFHDLASSVAALAGGQATSLGSTITSLAAGKDVWLLVDLVVAIPALWWLSRREGHQLARATRWVPLFLAVVAIPFLWSGTAALAKSKLHDRRNLQNLRSVSEYGLFGFQILDAGTRLVRSFGGNEATPDEKDRVTRWFENSAAQRRNPSASVAPARGLNLIGIQVESMQAFVLDLEIDGQPVTPNLGRFREQALDFSMVLDQTSRGRSSAGDFVTMTSLLPVGESIAYEYPDNDYFSIAHALAREGYRTLSAIPYKGSFWNRRVTHSAYGFDTNLFVDQFEQRGPKVGWGINDSDFLGQMVPILEALEEPFFSWLTTLTVHFPYESFPAELERLDLGKLEDTPLGNYLHGMNFFDRALGEFLESLDRDLLQRTVIAIWSDHASGLERDEAFVDYFGLETPAERFLFRRVPFVVRLPGEGALSGRFDLAAGQVDIAPTLLGLLDVDPAGLALMGSNLLGAGRSTPVVHPQGRWFDGDLIYLSQFADSDGGCWSAGRLRRVEPAECAAGTAAARMQLDVVSLLLDRNLQAETTLRLNR